MIGTMDDDTTNLISELLQKLADHQRQIDSFCRAQAQVFTRYQNEVLENAPRHVSSKVEEAIARTLHKYPALKSGFEQLRREQREQRQEQLSWPQIHPEKERDDEKEERLGEQQQRRHHSFGTADSYIPPLDTIGTTDTNTNTTNAGTSSSSSSSSSATTIPTTPTTTVTVATPSSPSSYHPSSTPISTSTSTFTPSTPSAPSTTSTVHTHDTTQTKNLNRMARSGNRGSPPPTSPHGLGSGPGLGSGSGSGPASGASPEHSPTSPRERELELHGLFIPTYLPLLEDPERRQSPNPPPTPASSLPTVPENGDRSPNRSEAKSPASLTSLVTIRPDPKRRHTGDTLSSITSDDSNSRIKRSALRRSSSSSTKTFSPRRVRFEVEGQEVLPTASPQPRPSDHLSQPPGSISDVANESSHPDLPQGEENGDLGLLGSSPPRPKKITSTDKLKALARQSTEDTSSWTVVGNPQGTDDDEDDELVMADLGRRRRRGESQAAAATQNPGPHLPSINSPGPSTLAGTPLQSVRESEYDSDLDGDGAENSMPALTSFKGKKRFSPEPSSTALGEMAPRQREAHGAKTPTENIPIPPKSGSAFSLDDGGEEEEDLFGFEDDSIKDTTGRESPRDRTTKYTEDYDDLVEDSKGKRPARTADEKTPSTHPISPYSSSLSRNIPKPRSPKISPPTSFRQGTSIGSYRGKPIQMSSVRNEEVHKKAQAMGDFQSFIGSVDGRSGIDESTSYRPETMKFVGEPRSFSERFFREEIEEQHQTPRRSP